MRSKTYAFEISMNYSLVVHINQPSSDPSELQPSLAASWDFGQENLPALTGRHGGSPLYIPQYCHSISTLIPSQANYRSLSHPIVVARLDDGGPSMLRLPCKTSTPPSQFSAYKYTALPITHFFDVYGVFPREDPENMDRHLLTLVFSLPHVCKPMKNRILRLIEAVGDF